jgi:hypothetical protein
MTAPPSPTRLSWSVWVSAVAVLVAVAGVMSFVVIQQRADAARRERADAAESTAWENRVEMDQVVAETARLLGIETAPSSSDEAPLTCQRRDGRRGVSLFLHKVEGAPPHDPEAQLMEVAEKWAADGYAVPAVGGGPGGVWRATAETPEWAILEAATGPGGTVISGETMCALTDGRPGSESTGE